MRRLSSVPRDGACPPGVIFRSKNGSRFGQRRFCRISASSKYKCGVAREAAVRHAAAESHSVFLKGISGGAVAKRTGKFWTKVAIEGCQ